MDLTLPRSQFWCYFIRDVKDATVSTLATEVSGKVQGVQGLSSRLGEIRQYLDLVLNGKMPVNHEIMKQLQVRRSLDALQCPR